MPALMAGLCAGLLLSATQVAANPACKAPAWIAHMNLIAFLGVIAAAAGQGT